MLKRISIIAIFASMFGVCAMAAEEKTPELANIKVGALDANLGLEFRADYTYDNQGLTKTDTSDPVKTSTLTIPVAKLKFFGKANKEVSYSFRFNLLPGDTTANKILDYGFVTLSPMPIFGLSMGRIKVKQGGWEQIDAGYKVIEKSIYLDNLPLNAYDSMLMFDFAVAGHIYLQAMNDVVKDTTPSAPATDTYFQYLAKQRWNTTAKQPAMILSYEGQKFGPVAPLVQFASYDLNHSKYYDVGLKFDMANIAATLDWTNDVRSIMVKDKADPEKDTGLDATVTSYVLNASYLVPKLVKPFLHYSMFNVKQPDNADYYMTDVKGNTFTGKFDDNGNVIGVGTYFEMLGENYEPYFAIQQKSGKWFKSLLTSDETEARSGMTISAGMIAGF